jgi:predicted GIY-YIG superfamily endonuclease
LLRAIAVQKRFVYGLRSVADRRRHYIGLTADVARRVEWHNAGRCPHTAKYRPWALVVAIEFADEARAVVFEKYLKSGSGRAFAKRHFGCCVLLTAARSRRVFCERRIR